jgi:hypothetical protein
VTAGESNGEGLERRVAVDRGCGSCGAAQVTGGGEQDQCLAVLLQINAEEDSVSSRLYRLFSADWKTGIPWMPVYMSV